MWYFGGDGVAGGTCLHGKAKERGRKVSVVQQFFGKEPPQEKTKRAGQLVD